MAGHSGCGFQAEQSTGSVCRFRPRRRDVGRGLAAARTWRQVQSGHWARAAFSLLEMLAILTLIGILAAVVLPRLTSHSAAARHAACHAQRGNLEVQAQLWYRNKGTWPNSNLSDLAADPAYLPDGLPSCPVDGSAYVFDSSTQEVTGHNH